MWEVVATEEFSSWFGEQSTVAQEALRYGVRLLMQTGPLLGRPYVDTLKGSRYSNMKELRVGARGMALRVAFAFDPSRRAILLIGGDKRGVGQALFYKRLIANADALFAEYLKNR